MQKDRVEGIVSKKYYIWKLYIREIAERYNISQKKIFSELFKRKKLVFRKN